MGVVPGGTLHKFVHAYVDPCTAEPTAPIGEIRQCASIKTMFQVEPVPTSVLEALPSDPLGETQVVVSVHYTPKPVVCLWAQFTPRGATGQHLNTRPVLIALCIGQCPVPYDSEWALTGGCIGAKYNGREIEKGTPLWYGTYAGGRDSTDSKAGISKPITEVVLDKGRGDPHIYHTGLSDDFELPLRHVPRWYTGYNAKLGVGGGAPTVRTQRLRYIDTWLNVAGSGWRTITRTMHDMDAQGNILVSAVGNYIGESNNPFDDKSGINLAFMNYGLSDQSDGSDDLEDTQDSSKVFTYYDLVAYFSQATAPTTSIPGAAFGLQRRLIDNFTMTVTGIVAYTNEDHMCYYKPAESEYGLKEVYEQVKQLVNMPQTPYLATEKTFAKRAGEAAHYLLRSAQAMPFIGDSIATAVEVGRKGIHLGAAMGIHYTSPSKRFNRAFSQFKAGWRGRK